MEPAIRLRLDISELKTFQNHLSSCIHAFLESDPYRHLIHKTYKVAMDAKEDIENLQFDRLIESYKIQLPNPFYKNSDQKEKTRLSIFKKKTEASQPIETLGFKDWVESTTRQIIAYEKQLLNEHLGFAATYHLKNESNQYERRWLKNLLKDLHPNDIIKFSNELENPSNVSLLEAFGGKSPLGIHAAHALKYLNSEYEKYHHVQELLLYQKKVIIIYSLKDLYYYQSTLHESINCIETFIKSHQTLPINSTVNLSPYQERIYRLETELGTNLKYIFELLTRVWQVSIHEPYDLNHQNISSTIPNEEVFKVKTLALNIFNKINELSHKPLEMLSKKPPFALTTLTIPHENTKENIFSLSPIKDALSKYTSLEEELKNFENTSGVLKTDEDTSSVEQPKIPALIRDTEEKSEEPEPPLDSQFTDSSSSSSETGSQSPALGSSEEYVKVDLEVKLSSQ